MKLIILTLLIIYSSIFYAQSNKLTYSEGVCPIEWFSEEDTIIQEYKRTLAWVHKVDNYNIETRNVIVLLVSEDSIGAPIYFIEELAADKDDLKSWYRNDIILGQDSSRNIGFYESHLEFFSKKPSEKELYQLLDKWKFKLSENKWNIYESGLNIQLWLKTFGFKPNRELKVK